jgi:peptide/nickel transport system permease protein
MTRMILSILGVVSTTIFPPLLVFLIARFLRDPLFDLRDAMGLPVDSLDIWRDVSVEPFEVLALMSFALLGASVAAFAMRTWAHRRRVRWVALLAFPVALAAAATGIAVAGVGTEALDLLYRIDISTSITSGSPVLVLIGVVLISFGQVMFVMRVGIQDERNEDYVLTARSKGLPEREVRDRHVARNALAPTIAGSLLAIPTLLAGMVIIEWGLEVQGLSTLFFQAVESQDIPLIMGVLVVLGLFGVVIRIVADVCIAYLDPRQRRAG